MVFSSTEFLFLFFPALLVLYYFPGLNHRIYRNTVLLLASLFFYAWGEPAFVFVMLISVFVNWLIGIIMDNQTKHKNRKCWLVFAIAFDVFLLAVFKYASFASENLAALTGNDKLIINVALPIGISFFTFQMMSYVFDIYYGSVCAQKNPLYVALYVSLFPQLIAGPIVRYQQIEMEITDRHETMEHVSSGLRRFIYGLGKKVLLANFLAQIADNIFGFLSASSVMMAWLGAISYTLQIYFDFSGYSDMAIGLGEMFGFHFLENFNYPYISKSVTEFWRRWHISLSTWFRDYVYIPLGGGRVKKSRWVLNLFVVWLLTGIWHGANWTFVLWGLFYFFILLIEKLTGVAESDKLRGAVFSHVYTMLVVIIGWVIFRANDVVSGISYIGTMFGIGIADFIDLGFIEYIKNAAFLLLAALVGCTPLVNNITKWLQRKGLAWIEYTWLFVVFAISLLEVICSTYNPFIYFNF